MAGCCQGCGTIATNKYWNELPCAKHRFFKAMTGDFHHLMKIPDEFKTCFKGELAGWWVLRGPSGQEWRVKITQTRKHAYFHEGWDNFVRDHDLKPLDFCVFSNSKASTFDVLIFKRNGSEREGAYFATKSSLFSSSGMCTSYLHPHGSNAEVVNVEESEDEYDKNGMLDKEQGVYDMDDEKDEDVNEEDEDVDKRKRKRMRMRMYKRKRKRMRIEDEDEDVQEKEDEDEEVPSRDNTEELGFAAYVPSKP